MRLIIILLVAAFLTGCAMIPYETQEAKWQAQRCES